MTVHPYELVKINDKTCEVDVGMISLVKELNKAGLTTVESCQGSNDNHDFFSKKTSLRYFSIKLGENIGFKVEPLGSRGEQTLVIYWKNTEKELGEANG